MRGTRGPTGPSSSSTSTLGWLLPRAMFLVLMIMGIVFYAYLWSMRFTTAQHETELVSLSRAVSVLEANSKSLRSDVRQIKETIQELDRQHRRVQNVGQSGAIQSQGAFPQGVEFQKALAAFAEQHNKQLQQQQQQIIKLQQQQQQQQSPQDGGANPMIRGLGSFHLPGLPDMSVLKKAQQQQASDTSSSIKNIYDGPVFPPAPETLRGAQIAQYDRVPFHLLNPNSTLNINRMAFRRVKSLPEVIAQENLSPIAASGWTHDLLNQQLKLLLQVDENPNQKHDWIVKLLSQYLPEHHRTSSDFTHENGQPFIFRQKCSALSRDVPWDREYLLTMMKEFLSLYTNFTARPFEFNPLGQRLTHSFSTWFHAKRMQPKYIIESGVNWGHTTWLLRKAAPNAKIICLDPALTSIRHWDKQATYFTGDGTLQGGAPDVRPFVDFSKIDWSFIPMEDRKHNTLILFDDHQDEWVRVQDMRPHGFRKAMFDDNWFEQQGDNFSLKQLCDESGGTTFPTAEPGKVLRMSNFSMNNRWMSLEEHQADRNMFIKYVSLYYEMPPVLWYPSLIKHSQFRTFPRKDFPNNLALLYLTAGSVSPPLVQTQAEFDELGLNQVALREFWFYMNHAYLELK